MWHTIETGFAAYCLVVVIIFTFQRRLMYFPVRSVALPQALGLTNVQEIFLTANDGAVLQTWVHIARPGYPTLLYFHGNAYHLGERASKFSGFADAGFGLIAVSYRGFGKSSGSPCEQGLYADARAAIDYALELSGLAQDKLIYFGESLGSGVAVQMASERAPGLLVLEAAYTSVETRSAELYPYILGVRRFVLDKYDSLSTITRVHAPLLMLHGEKDSTIPLRHGKTLFAAANEPKTLVIYPDVHHADYSNEQILVPLLDAARKHGLII
jgi:uncharacterized protein